MHLPAEIVVFTRLHSLLGLGNPFAGLGGLELRERSVLLRPQKAEKLTEFRYLPYPLHVTDDGAALPVEEVTEAELGVLPDRGGIETGNVGGDLTVDAHLAVPAEFVFKVGYQHVS